MTDATGLSAEEWDAWRSIQSMRRRLDRTLERQLQRDSDISAPDYEVLLSLFGSPDRRMRTRELAIAVNWEKSRVSHQVTRMERRGLVTRSECDTDARGTWISLTAAGSRAVLGSMREHAASIRKYFFDVLAPGELEVLTTAAARVLEGLEPGDCDGDDDGADGE